MAVKKVVKRKKIMRPLVGVKTKNEGLSQDTKTILVVVTLLLAYPIGVILMFMWMKWPTWLKLLAALPVVLVVLGFGVILLLVAISPKSNWENSKCARECRGNTSVCYQKCLGRSY